MKAFYFFKLSSKIVFLKKKTKPLVRPSWYSNLYAYMQLHSLLLYIRMLIFVSFSDISTHIIEMHAHTCRPKVGRSLILQKYQGNMSLFDVKNFRIQHNETIRVSFFCRTHACKHPPQRHLKTDIRSGW